MLSGRNICIPSSPVAHIWSGVSPSIVVKLGAFASVSTRCATKATGFEYRRPISFPAASLVAAAASSLAAAAAAASS